MASTTRHWNLACCSSWEVFVHLDRLECDPYFFMRSEFFSVSQKLEVRSGGQWKTSFDPLEVCLWCLWGPYHPTTYGAFWHPVKMLLRLHEPGWHRLQDASFSLSQAIKLLGIGKRLVTAHIRKSSMPCSQPQSSFQDCNGSTASNLSSYCIGC